MEVRGDEIRGMNCRIVEERGEKRVRKKEQVRRERREKSKKKRTSEKREEGKVKEKENK